MKWRIRWPLSLPLLSLGPVMGGGGEGAGGPQAGWLVALSPGPLCPGARPLIPCRRRFPPSAEVSRPAAWTQPGSQPAARRALLSASPARTGRTGAAPAGQQGWALGSGLAQGQSLQLPLRLLETHPFATGWGVTLAWPLQRLGLRPFLGLIPQHHCPLTDRELWPALGAWSPEPHSKQGVVFAGPLPCGVISGLGESVAQAVLVSGFTAGKGGSSSGLLVAKLSSHRVG